MMGKFPPPLHPTLDFHMHIFRSSADALLIW